MNRKLILTGTSILAVLAGYFVLFEQPGYFSRPSNSTTVAQSQGNGPGNSLVSEAARRMEFSQPFEAEMRQHVDLYGVQLQSPGRYMQAGQGSGKMRWELRTSLNGESGSLLRVSDGRFLYSRISFQQSTQLIRVDLSEVNQLLDERVPLADDANATGNDWMYGGLAYLLKRLEHDFAFDKAEPDMLGQVPVWRLSGTWKTAALEQMMLMQTGHVIAGSDITESMLPDQIPTHVELVLGRNVEPQLFPYQIRFIRRSESNTRDAASEDDDSAQVLMSLEFIRVAMNVDIDESTFVYDPGDEEIDYRTGDYTGTLSARFPERASAESDSETTNR